jgi:hypothetical protein
VSELIRSAVTLAHEAYHVGGELNEKRAQCFGLQGAAHVAQRLGIPPSLSDQIAWVRVEVLGGPEVVRLARMS